MLEHNVGQLERKDKRSAEALLATAMDGGNVGLQPIRVWSNAGAVFDLALCLHSRKAWA